MADYLHHPDGWLRIRDDAGNEYIDMLANLAIDAGTPAPSLPEGAIRRYYNDREQRHLVADEASETVSAYPVPEIAALIAAAGDLVERAETRRAAEALAAEQAEAKRIAAEIDAINAAAEADRIAAEQAAADELARLEAEAEAERLAAEQAAAEAAASEPDTTEPAP